MEDKREKVFKYGAREFIYTYEAADDPLAPLVVILHGHSKEPRASRFRSSEWNVLCPVDRYGYQGWGSWFLGEDGEYFWLEAMPALVRYVYKGRKIYFCGSSMGGYGAILHGIQMRAYGVYANVAQTRLLGSTYSESGMKKFFEPIFGTDRRSRFNDLGSLITRDLPTSFILTGLRWDKPCYLEEQTFPFLDKLCRCEVNFRSEIRFGHGHSLTYTMPEAINLFKSAGEDIEGHYEAKIAAQG